MLCQVLEVVGLEIAVRHVVHHRKVQRIDHMPSEEVVPGIVDDPFSQAEPARPLLRRRAAAPERQPHLVPLRARLEIRQVEAAEVMPLDHVGVAFRNRPHERFDQLFFAHRILRQRQLPAGGVAHRNNDDLVPRTVRIRKVEARRGPDFEVELKPPQFPEFHPGEQPRLLLLQNLLRVIPEDEIRPPAFFQVLQSEFILRDGRKLRQETENHIPVERRNRRRAGKIFQLLRRTQQQHRRKRHRLLPESAAVMIEENRIVIARLHGNHAAAPGIHEFFKKHAPPPSSLDCHMQECTTSAPFSQPPHWKYASFFPHPTLRR